MSLRNLASTYPKGPAVVIRGPDRRDPAPEGVRSLARPVAAPSRASNGHPGQRLDKTLSNVREGLPKGPEITPGGHGQVWRDK
jgi:hypothetical protein